MSISAADVGSRVSIRRSLPDGMLSDVLGELIGWSDRTLTVRRKDGITVDVDEATLVAGKVVPPRRVIARTHTAVGVADLEEVAALGWQATETGHLGGWLLRAAGGWTGRANSALPLRDPGLDVDPAIDAVAAWYAARGLPARVQVPLPLAAELDVRLAERGWSAPDGVGGIHVMTADVAGVLAEADAARGDLPPVELAPAPSDDWLETYRYRGGALPPEALAMLTNAAAPVFAEVRSDGATLAVGRGSVDSGWIGITAMETAPSAQRRGLGRHVLLALVAHARIAGARHVYLQVSADNAGAIALYASLGLTVHHSYHYRIAP